MGFISVMQDWLNMGETIMPFFNTSIDKKENHMILPTGAEKAFDKIQHPFLIKALTKPGTEENFLKLIKTIHRKSAAIILNSEKFTTFLSGIKLSSLITISQHQTGGPY